MSESDALLILEQACDEAIAWVSRQVRLAGLQLVRTFDLRTARQAHADCPCPHHGTAQCDCQMVVLLVYGGDHRPISLVAHSHDGVTRLSLVDTPQQRADPRLEATILGALKLEASLDREAVKSPQEL